MENWVPVNSYYDAVQAHFARARLEGEGIEARVIDEVASTVMWQYAQAFGGVKVLVKEEEVERAAQVLSRPLQERSEEMEEEDGALRCPDCGSGRFYRGGRTVWFGFLTVLLVGFPLLFHRPGWHCRACGFRSTTP